MNNIKTDLYTNEHRRWLRSRLYDCTEYCGCVYFGGDVGSLYCERFSWIDIMCIM